MEDKANQEEYVPLDQQIGFLMYVCSKEMLRLYKTFLEPFDLTYTQYIVLQSLYEKNPVSLKELGKRLYLDSGTLTPIVKRLEKRNLVFRRTNKEDERSIFVCLTPEGRTLREKIPPLSRKVFELGGCSVEEAGTLFDILKSTLSNFYPQED